MRLDIARECVGSLGAGAAAKMKEFTGLAHYFAWQDNDRRQGATPDPTRVFIEYARWERVRHIDKSYVYRDPRTITRPGDAAVREPVCATTAPFWRSRDAVAIVGEYLQAAVAFAHRAWHSKRSHARGQRADASRAADPMATAASRR